MPDFRNPDCHRFLAKLNGQDLLRMPVNPPAKLRAFAGALKAFIGTGPVWSHEAAPAS